MEIAAEHTTAGHAARTGEEVGLWRALGRVTQRLPRLLDEAMVRDTGLTMTEFAILDALSEAPDTTARVSELAAAIGLSPSRVSRALDALTSHGWCRRQPDVRDKRAALAVLSDEGRERVKAAMPHHQRLAHEYVLAHVPTDVRAALTAALTAIAEANHNHS
ncbi:MAG: MarR family transcriptional regulator [Mycobacterium sp.]